jgi:hypothetical protein
MHRDAEALPFRRRQRIEMGGRHGLGHAVALDEIEIEAGLQPRGDRRAAPGQHFEFGAPRSTKMGNDEDGQYCFAVAL